MTHRSATSIPALYERHAGLWAEARGRRLPEGEQEWLKRFTNRLPQNGTVLDIGCGNGLPIGRWLVEQGNRMTGVDVSRQMIVRFKENLPGQKAVLSDMRKLSLDNLFDGVLAWCSFFHLCQEDQRAMFAIFSRHARSGAPLMFTSGPEQGEAIGEFGGEELYHASLSSAEYRELLEENGFSVISHVAEDPECLGFTVWLAEKC